MKNWEPKTKEDLILKKYWETHGGKIFAEVPVGSSWVNVQWKAGSDTRRLDGVRIIIEEE